MNHIYWRSVAGHDLAKTYLCEWQEPIYKLSFLRKNINGYIWVFLFSEQKIYVIIKRV